MTGDEGASSARSAAGVGAGAKRRAADARKRANEPHIGKALRSVYDTTVSETVPDDLLDLLGRLD